MTSPVPVPNHPSVPAPRFGLAGAFYYSPEVFAAARRGVFGRAWIYAGHVSQLQNPGDYAAVPHCAGGIFAVRGDDGELRAFFNVCRHRGHPLLPDGCGSRKRDIVCPYHSWSYDLRGKLRAARNLDKVAGVRVDNIRLASARVESFCGFVFVNADSSAPTMDEMFPGVASAVRAACPDIENRVPAFSHSADEQCNWLVAVENYNECYHCKVAHPAFSRGVVDPKSYNIAPFGGGKCLRHSAKAASGTGAWTSADNIGDYASFFLWPAFSVQIYPGGIVNTYRWLPLAANDTRVTREWFARPGEEDDAHLKKVAELDRETTFAEDLRIVAQVQKGVESAAFVPGPLVLNPAAGIDSEHSVAALHDWFLEGVKGGDGSGNGVDGSGFGDNGFGNGVDGSGNGVRSLILSRESGNLAEREKIPAFAGKE